MANVNTEDFIAAYPGMLYVAKLDGLDIPELEDDLSNVEQFKAEIEAQTEFIEMGGFVDLTRNIDSETNMIEAESDQKTEYISTEDEVTITADWMRAGDVESVAGLMGLQLKSVAADPVDVIDENISDSGVAAYETYELMYHNDDGSAVTDVTVYADSTDLVEWTDYEVKVEDGKSKILFTSEQTGVITVDYTYTPAESKYIGENIKSRKVPRLLVKIVSLDADRWTNVEYGVDARFNGTLSQTYLNPARAGDIGSSDFSLQINSGGTWLMQAERLG